MQNTVSSLIFRLRAFAKSFSSDKAQKHSMMKLLSQIISYLFHPMLMASLGIFLIFNSGTHIAFIPIEAKRVIYLTVILNTAILPLSTLPLLYQFGLIKSFQMESARERTLPVLLTCFFYFVCYMLLRRIGVTGIIISFMLATIIAIAGAGIITRFWKISIHTIGIGGVTGTIMALTYRYGVDLNGMLFLLFLCSGLVASARLYLGAHSPAQVYAGFIWGFAIVFSSVLL